MGDTRFGTFGRRLLGLGPSAIVAGGISLLVVGGLGSSRLYERRHISADLRQNLLVALAPGTPDTAMVKSLDRAKTHLRTLRDHQEYNKLQHAVELTQTARSREVQLVGQLRQAQAELDAEMHSERLMIVTERAYLNSHQAMPAGLAADVAGEQLRRERVRDQQRRAEEGAWLDVLQQRLDAQVLMQELRVDLGLARPAPRS